MRLRSIDRGSSGGAFVLLSLWMLASPVTLLGQQRDGTTVSTIGGAALGLYSGGMFGVVGGLLPCDRTLLGGGCAAVTGAAGGALGLITGGLIGTKDIDETRDRARGAGYGALLGYAVGLVLQQAVRQYAWNDALLVAGYGAAIGAAPVGTLIGTGVGAAVGGLAWAISPRGGLQDLVMFTVVGSALGGLYDWTAGAVDSTNDGGPRLTSGFSIGVG